MQDDKALFKIQVLHDYLNKQFSDWIKIEPTAETQSLLEEYDLEGNSENNSIQLLAKASTKDKLQEEATTLSFVFDLLIQKDDFYEYTFLPTFQQHQKCLFFSNKNSQRHILPAAHFASQQDLKAQDASNPLRPEVYGQVEIKLETVELINTLESKSNELNFEIPFQNNYLIWNYYFIAQTLEVQSYSITDNKGENNFKAAETVSLKNNVDAQLISSKTPMIVKSNYDEAARLTLNVKIKHQPQELKINLPMANCDTVQDTNEVKLFVYV